MARPRNPFAVGGRTLRDGRRLYWWREVAAVGVFYALYSLVRNLNDASSARAFAHARDVIDLQKTLGINQEHAVQAWALGSHTLIVAANYFYGSLHFIVTALVLVYLYRRFADDFPLWRNTLAIATATALIGFTFFPLMPPRLLDEFARSVHSSFHFGFVDTLAKDPAFWSFGSGTVNHISNQYAAMPSVHCAWALWCACVLVPRLRRPWAKLLATLYPAMTVFVIVVTANHYFLDAVAGFTVLGAGYLIARAVTRSGRAPARVGEPVAILAGSGAPVGAHHVPDDEPE